MCEIIVADDHPEDVMEDTMLDDRLHYRTCIVRAWRDGTGVPDDANWRLTLEVPALGLRKGFNSFHELAESMWRHLSEESGEPPASPSVADAGGSL